MQRHKIQNQSLKGAVESHYYQNQNNDNDDVNNNNEYVYIFYLSDCMFLPYHVRVSE